MHVSVLLHGRKRAEHFLERIPVKETKSNVKPSKKNTKNKAWNTRHYDVERKYYFCTHEGEIQE